MLNWIKLVRLGYWGRSCGYLNEDRLIMDVISIAGYSVIAFTSTAPLPQSQCLNGAFPSVCLHNTSHL